MPVQVVEEAHPARHRLLRLEQLQRHRIDQHLQAAGERALHRHATLRLGLALISTLRGVLLAAAELRTFARHAGVRQPYRRGFTRLDRPAHGNGNAAGVAGRGLRRLDQLGRRAPLANRRRRRFALAQQMLDVVGIDQHRAGDSHHHKRQQQDQANPKVELLQPIAEGAALGLGRAGHGRFPGSRAGGGWPDEGRGEGAILRRGCARSGRSRARPHRPAPACRRR